MVIQKEPFLSQDFGTAEGGYAQYWPIKQLNVPKKEILFS